MRTLKEKMESNGHWEPKNKEQTLKEIKDWFDSGSISKEKYDHLVSAVKNSTAK
jgi:hypothetical protein